MTGLDSSLRLFRALREVFFSWTLLLVLPILLCNESCSSRDRGPLVRLHLALVDPTTTQAAVDVTAQDATGLQKMTEFPFGTGPFDLFGVEFPPGTRGATSYQVNLYSGPSCLIASGVANSILDGDNVFDVAVAMTPVVLCGNAATLTVQVANILGGAGSVTSVPAGIGCQGSGNGCSATFMKGTQVTLTAQAAGGTFSGWSGAGCSGTGGCSLTLSQDAQVQAVFTACRGWCVEPLPFPVAANFNSVSGTGANNVLIVGDDGTAVRFDGIAWQKLQSPAGSVSLRAAAGRFGGSILTVAGDGGKIFQLRDTIWSPITNASTINLRSIAIGDGPSPNIFFVGDEGTALTLPAGQSSVVNHTAMSKTLVNINSIAQNPNATKDDLLIVGAVSLAQGLAESWDGNSYFNAQMTSGSATIAGNINAVLCETLNFYAAGDMGAIVSRASAGGAAGGANKWVAVTSGTNSTLRGMWSTSDSNIYAVGDGGTIIHYDGTIWNKVIPITSNTLRAIWGSSATNIYAVGDGGLLLHYLP